jgi:hypothetical protein
MLVTHLSSLRQDFEYHAMMHNARQAQRTQRDHKTNKIQLYKRTGKRGRKTCEQIFCKCARLNTFLNITVLKGLSI